MAICKANGRISERLMNPMAIYHGIAVKVKGNSSAFLSYWDATGRCGTSTYL
ncbi:hypothetical protein M433DRAFT_160214, partial [Acidomyces richmondensis BFW]